MDGVDGVDRVDMMDIDRGTGSGATGKIGSGSGGRVRELSGPDGIAVPGKRETGTGFPGLRPCLVGIGKAERSVVDGMDRVDMIDTDRESGEGSDFQ